MPNTIQFMEHPLKKPQIQVTLRCFSSVKHILGSSFVTLTIPESSTVEDLERQVRKELVPGLADLAFRVAVNREIVSENTTLKNGDEVALLPPMQGG